MTDSKFPTVVHNPWRGLRQYTPARIGLGRAGVSLPTAELLEFQLAHARARDAVHHPLDIEQSLAGLFSSQVPYACAACAWMIDDTESLAIFQELQQPASNEDYLGWIELVKQRIHQQFEVIPARILLLAPGSLPRTHNGKMQRVGCLKLFDDNAPKDRIWFDWSSTKTNEMSSSPCNESPIAKPESATEKTLFDIWCQVFNKSEFSIHSDFIALGGQSIVATQAVAQIRDCFGVEISLASLFQLGTIHNLAEFLDQALADRKSTR